jgi:hypothetical protein
VFVPVPCAHAAPDATASSMTRNVDDQRENQRADGIAGVRFLAMFAPSYLACHFLQH